jgi:phage tail-like protein
MTLEARLPSAEGASLSGLGAGGPGELVPAGPGAVAVRAARPAPLEIAHVASAYRRYPGERVTFFTRVQVRAALSGFSTQISLPSGLLPEARRASPGHGDRLPETVQVNGGSRYLIWTVERHVQPGEVFEYEVDAVVRPTAVDVSLESQAIITPGGPEARAAVVETVSIAVPARGRYLQYLPRVYQEQDELMGRFLMLFESFWAPVDAQTDHLAYYFDPEFTPAALLPWLATWVDLALDERWPEDKRRRLLSKAVSLYRKRGTRRGLQEYLEIYTGARVQISEHGANNFRLGPDARLGLGVALGTLNMPHTFTVTVFLPAEAAAAASIDDRARVEAERRRMIEAIIEAEKPAHTSYNLRLETV